MHRIIPRLILTAILMRSLQELYGNASKEEYIDTPVEERATSVITKDEQECAAIHADEGAPSIKPEEGEH